MILFHCNRLSILKVIYGANFTKPKFRRRKKVRRTLALMFTWHLLMSCHFDYVMSTEIIARPVFYCSICDVTPESEIISICYSADVYVGDHDDQNISTKFCTLLNH